jgi:guanylate kinase
MPPSFSELENRLKSRSSDSKESIRKRITKAKEEITFSKDFDRVIINDVLESALKETEQIVGNFLKSNQ